MLVLLIGGFAGDGCKWQLFHHIPHVHEHQQQEAQTVDVLKGRGGQKLSLLEARLEVALSVIILTWWRIMAAAFSLPAVGLSNLS